MQAGPLGGSLQLPTGEYHDSLNVYRNQFVKFKPNLFGCHI